MPQLEEINNKYVKLDLIFHNPLYLFSNITAWNVDAGRQFCPYNLILTSVYPNFLRFRDF